VAWLGPITSASGVSSDTSATLRQRCGGCYFRWGSVHRRLVCMPAHWMLSGAESPWAPLFHVGTAMRFPQVRQPRVNSVVRLTGALDMYTGAYEDHPVQAQPVLAGDEGFYG